MRFRFAFVKCVGWVEQHGLVGVGVVRVVSVGVVFVVLVVKVVFAVHGVVAGVVFVV